MNKTPPLLYMVATPIGNREDISLRALRLLKTAAVIAAEDTRRAKQLLSLYDIPTPPRLLSVRAHNEARASARLLSLVTELPSGSHAVYVSDAGTPGVSDPGARLVAAARARGIAVVPIPGASALTTLLSIVGAGDNAGDAAVHFYGFAPAASKQRMAFLQTLQQAAGYHVFFEAPHRMAQTLADSAQVLGDSCRCVLGRELTKQHEQIVDDTLGNIAARFQTGEIPARGEFVLLIDIAQATPAAAVAAQALFERLQAELPPRRAAAIAANFCDKPAAYFYQQHIKNTKKH